MWYWLLHQHHLDGGFLMCRLRVLLLLVSLKAVVGQLRQQLGRLTKYACLLTCCCGLIVTMVSLGRWALQNSSSRGVAGQHIHDVESSPSMYYRMIRHEL